MRSFPNSLTLGRVLSAALGGLCLLTTTLHAAADASDNAGNYGGWTSGSNGGTGFGAWTFANTNGDTGNSNDYGEFLGSSGNNGGGNPNNTGGNINTGGVSFGMYSNSGNTATATRSFTGGLSVNQTFSLQMDNGYLNNGGTVGFELLTANSSGTVTTANPRFQVFFLGGSGGYRVVGNTTQITSTGFTDNGMTTALTLTSVDTFAFTVAFNGGATENFTGTLGGTAGSSIVGFEIFSTNVGTGGQNDAFFNSPIITGDDTAVPEPGTVFGGLCVTLIFGSALRRRLRPAQA